MSKRIEPRRLIGYSQALDQRVAQLKAIAHNDSRQGTATIERKDVISLLLSPPGGGRVDRRTGLSMSHGRKCHEYRGEIRTPS